MIRNKRITWCLAPIMSLWTVACCTGFAADTASAPGQTGDQELAVQAAEAAANLGYPPWTAKAIRDAACARFVSASVTFSTNPTLHACMRLKFSAPVQWSTSWNGDEQVLDIVVERALFPSGDVDLTSTALRSVRTSTMTYEQLLPEPRVRIRLQATRPLPHAVRCAGATLVINIVDKEAVPGRDLDTHMAWTLVDACALARRGLSAATEQGMHDRTGRLATQAVRLCPAMRAAYVTLAEWHQVQGERLSAIEAFENANRLLPLAGDLRTLGRLYEQAGDKVGAERTQQRAARLRPESIELPGSPAAPLPPEHMVGTPDVRSPRVPEPLPRASGGGTDDASPGADSLPANTVHKDFTNLEAAAACMEALSDAGLVSRLCYPQDPHQSAPVFRVLIGPLENRDQVERASKVLRACAETKRSK